MKTHNQSFDSSKNSHQLNNNRSDFNLRAFKKSIDDSSKSMGQIEKMHVIYKDLKETERLLVSAMEQGYQRGLKLENLATKSMQLVDTSNRFKRSSQNLAKRYQPKTPLFFFCLILLLAAAMDSVLIGLGIKFSLLQSKIMNVIGYSFLIVSLGLTISMMVSILWRTCAKYEFKNDMDMSKTEIVPRLNEKKIPNSNQITIPLKKPTQRMKSVPVIHHSYSKQDVNTPTFFKRSKKKITFGKAALINLNFKIPKNARQEDKNTMISIKKAIKKVKNVKQLFKVLKLAHDKLDSRSNNNNVNVFHYIQTLISNAIKSYGIEGKNAYQEVFKQKRIDTTPDLNLIKLNFM